MQLYRERYPYLLRIALKHAANREDAEEAVQFSLSAPIDKYDPAAGSPPLAWVTLVLQRRCWALHRESHVGRRPARRPLRTRQAAASRRSRSLPVTPVPSS